MCGVRAWTGRRWIYSNNNEPMQDKQQAINNQQARSQNDAQCWLAGWLEKQLAVVSSHSLKFQECSNHNNNVILKLFTWPWLLISDSS